MIDNDNKQHCNSETEAKDVVQKIKIIKETDSKNKIESPQLSPTKNEDNENEEKPLTKVRKKVRKVIGDIHLKQNHLRRMGQDFCETLFLFFNEGIMMRKLHNLRRHHRPKAIVKKKPTKKTETTKTLENSQAVKVTHVKAKKSKT